MNLADWENGTINTSGVEGSSNTIVRTKNYIDCSTNKTFTFSKTIAMTTSVNNMMARCYDENKNFLGSVAALNYNYLTNTVTFNASYKYFRLVQFGNGSENPQETDYKLKCEKGTKATPYSPYGMGCMNEKIQNKNFANLDLLFGNTQYYNIDNNGVITVVANDGRAWTALDGKTWGIFIKAGTYILSFTENYTNQIQIQGKLSGQIIRTVANSKKLSFSLEQDDIIGIKFLNNSTYPCNIGNIQIEQGSTPTSYVAHEEQNISIPTQQPMRAIGEYKDTFVKVDGTWYERHYIGQVVLDGSESGWKRTPTGNNNYYYFFIDEIVLNCLFNSNVIIGMSNIGITANPYRERQGVDTIFYDSHNRTRLYAEATKAMSISDFQTWLSNNNVELIYVLATPVDLPCTEEQIEALNSLSYMTLYDGITYINSDANIEFRYVAEYETIDEEFLKDVNVGFGQKYGPINSIVLSRAAESDNVYLRNERSVQEDGLCEIKIVDNQIMNFNNRSDFLQGILDALGGLEYYINDFNSLGILYLSLLDRYSIQIGENRYKSIMLNDEVNVTTGIEEIVYTDMPEQSETDYTKADKTDRRMNQTYLIVDKQNQEIKAVVKQTIDQNNPNSAVNKVSRLNIRVGKLESSIKDIADITTYGESDSAYVELEGINQSEPIMLKVHPTTTNISYLYPRNNLYPSDIQYLPNRIIRFVRTYEEDGTTKTENIDYELPDDLLRYSSKVYDEFYLDYDSQTCQVIKRCGYNADGTVYQLANEITTNYAYPEILLDDGDYEIQLLGYDYGYLFVRLMAQNIYTTQFATKAEVTSEINQSAQQIDLSVNQKLTNYSTTTEMNSAITVKANEINSTVSQKVGKNEVISSINQSSEAVSINANKINLNGAVTANQNFKIKTDGSMEAKNGTFTGGNISLSGGTIENPRLQVVSSSSSSTKASIAPDAIRVGSGSVYLSFASGILNIRNNNSSFQMLASSSRINAGVDNFYVTGTVHANAYNYDSLESLKKNIKKYNKNVLDIIKNGEIYEFNFKTEDNEIKKHIGFIIPDEGGDFYTPNEVIAKDGKGIDAYNMASILWKAVQEQQEQIEKMEKEIEKLKGGRE